MVWILQYRVDNPKDCGDRKDEDKDPTDQREVVHLEFLPINANLHGTEGVEQESGKANKDHDMDPKKVVV
jgi:hypothetical protein